MKIFYVPLEPVKERYTVQLSAPVTGWLESRWIEYNIPYVRINGFAPIRDTIKHGTVLDAVNRGYWASSQIMELLYELDQGVLTSEDVIYFDDFWHSGMSALRYAFDQVGVRPKMFAMLHAQSIDPFDFTYPMRHWMRPFEIGIGKILDGIFVTSTCLQDMCIHAGIGTKETVHVCGLPYNSTEVRTHFPKNEMIPKQRQVVYSSRWDREKRPDVFLRIAQRVTKIDPSIKFVITTSAEKIKSNDSSLLGMLYEFLKKYPNNIELRENQTKEEYYRTLLESSVQLNTADQDFVSWTLLEATTAGCKPLYPYFLSFPEAIERDIYMYAKNDFVHGAAKVIELINAPKLDVDYIYQKYDKSWYRMYSVMKGQSYEALYRSTN